ncbi:MAG: outer membrane protein assembly factor BamA [Candidatus Krumholzibacteriota bacterium]|nr:outer membrane protein assembly factor BamA [Candidatus Krumholzibacteriota bacterium]
MVSKSNNYITDSLIILILFSLIVGGYSQKASSDDFGLDLPYVKRIVILGNISIEDRVLKKKMRSKEAKYYNIFNKPRFRRDFIKRDLESIKTYYHRNGYFDVSVTLVSIDRDDKANNVTIRILINEGPQTVVRNLKFSDQPIIDNKQILKGLRLTEGMPYNPNLVETDRYTLFSQFFKRGYLGAMVACNTDIDSTSVDISWDMSPGQPVRIREVIVTGNEKVKEDLIRRELKIGSGEYFQLSKIVESKQNLYDTGCFSSVEIEPTGLNADSGIVDLQLTVRDRKMGYLESGLGVGNVHANRVFAEWGQRNLIGRGYVLNIKTAFAFRLFEDDTYDLSSMNFENRYQRHEGELRFPHIFSTWNTFAIGSFYERDATVEPAIVEATSFSGTVSRRISRQTSLLLGYIYERVRRQEVVDERERSRRRSIDFTFRRDTRDYYFNPSRGRYIGLESRYAGGVLGGEDHYYSIVPSFQDYRKLSDQTVFAYRLRAGYAKAFGESSETGVPIESRYFLGGGNSVRGYRENTLGPLNSTTGEPRGGNIMILANLELRVPLPFISKYNFGGALFLDGGNVWDEPADIKLEDFIFIRDREDVSVNDFRYGAGFGLRYYTPVGPIRLDAGFPLIRSADIDYDYWIHISLGQIF